MTSNGKSWTKCVRIVLLVAGVALILHGVILLVRGVTTGCIAPLALGATLALMCYFRTRATIIIFGHTAIIVGCYLVAWGVYLVPQCRPVFRDIVAMPLFWGLFSIFGGICANFHGFCCCIQPIDPHTRDDVQDKVEAPCKATLG